MYYYSGFPEINTSTQKQIIAQNPTPATGEVKQNLGVGSQVLIYLPIGLALLFFVLLIYSQWQLQKKNKAIKFEQFKYKDLKKKLKLALTTIQKMETNPDLVHSRDFNLDYLRMRMDEEVFHYVIVNQIKTKVRQLITQALRPDTKKETTVGIANTSGRKVDTTFDVTYEIEANGEWKTNILFRVQIKLTKLPIRTSSSIVDEIIQCVENYLCPDETQNHWTPTIHGKVVAISWDQRAKPTPLLVLEQAEEGSVVLKSDVWGKSANSRQQADHQLK
ncbi:hypothetical protein [Gloeocapsa sp. PCC 73106]|uniref:hypothetical protein n=1 Tax=Gloeocapsa sp. PCC 73106 TaxID=102232 RepID=UPI0002ABDB36|nr:hypothetical protein [Gloeocapsa sp. PCC 73106]ELR98783.1 hypothetical protein GLO73106DRAFT_00026210 [Gloeocapsa sp. PCC 73106]